MRISVPSSLNIGYLELQSRASALSPRSFRSSFRGLIDDICASGSVIDQVPVLLEYSDRPEVHLAITHGVLLPSALKHLDRDW